MNNFQAGSIVKSGKVSIYVLGFETVMEPKRVFDPVKGTETIDGEEAVDYIHYSPAHTRDKTRIRKRIKDLQNLMRLEEGDEDPARLAAHNRWKAIKPLYDGWKGNFETPANGTPLNAWTAIPATYIPKIHAAGFRTVESLADASDSLLGQIGGVPDPRDLRVKAQAFVNAKATNVAVAQIELATSENKLLRDQIDEQGRQIAQLMAALSERMKAEDERAPRKPGRHPKAEVLEEAA